MFSWLKNFAAAADHALVSRGAINCWRECFAEVVVSQGAQHYDREFWVDVFAHFIEKWRQIHPQSQTLGPRCDLYFAFLEDIILGTPHIPEFTTAELERIGEFIAVAIVRDLREAFIADIEGAALVVDFLPLNWRRDAGIVPENFDKLYLAKTGKQRIHRL